jgi:hypothetical protein
MLFGFLQGEGGSNLRHFGKRFLLGQSPELQLDANNLLSGLSMARQRMMLYTHRSKEERACPIYRRVFVAQGSLRARAAPKSKAV